MADSNDAALSELKYDAFVSYSHIDKDWVNGELLPPLRKNNIRVIVDDDFPWGRTIDENIANAIAQSRRTLVVLSKNWVDSDWSNFELALTGIKDPAARRHRILPILIDDCDPPARLRILTWGDFRHIEERPAQMERLLRAIRGGDDQAPDGGVVSAAPARRGLIALHDLMDTPEIRKAALEFRGAFSGMCLRIDPVVKYKSMHDLLHRLEFNCFNRMRNNLARFADPNDELGYPEMESCQAELKDLERQFEEVGAHEVFRAVNMRWISDIEKASTALQQALDAREAGLETQAPAMWLGPAQKSVDAIGRVLARRPREINSYLVEAARALRLRDLVTAMSRLHSKLGDLDADSDRAGEFCRGVEALGNLASRLERLILIHGLWQDIDVELQPVEAILADSIAKGDYSWWENLKELTASLRKAHATDVIPSQGEGTPESPERTEPAESRISSLQDSTGKMDEAIATGVEVGIRRSFGRFQRLAKTTFRGTDEDLKRQCDELPSLFSPLRTVEEVLR
jgi:hypothetical protein